MTTMTISSTGWKDNKVMQAAVDALQDGDDTAEEAIKKAYSTH
jgi:hypothetical protein